MQSVGVHLVALCAALERGWPAPRTVELRRRAADSLAGVWTWLDPAVPLGSLTISDVLAPPTPEGRAERVTAYVDDVWRAYSPHLDLVRRWTSRLLSDDAHLS